MRGTAVSFITKWNGSKTGRITHVKEINIKRTLIQNFTKLKILKVRKKTIKAA